MLAVAPLPQPTIETTDPVKETPNTTDHNPPPIIPEPQPAIDPDDKDKYSTLKLQSIFYCNCN